MSTLEKVSPTTTNSSDSVPLAHSVLYRSKASRRRCPRHRKTRQQYLQSHCAQLNSHSTVTPLPFSQFSFLQDLSDQCAAGEFDPHRSPRNCVVGQATSAHLGMLKAKLAKLKRDLIDQVEFSSFLSESTVSRIKTTSDRQMNQQSNIVTWETLRVRCCGVTVLG